MKKENVKRIQYISWIVFAVYLILMVYFLFYSEQMGRKPGNAYRYNLQPFAEIKRYLKYSHRIGSFHVLLNLWGNVLCFVPFGFVIPILSASTRKFYKITILSFMASTIVEVIQLLSKRGSFDIDDILMNTLGGVIGYLFFAIGRWLSKKRRL